MKAGLSRKKKILFIFLGIFCILCLGAGVYIARIRYLKDNPLRVFTANASESEIPSDFWEEPAPEDLSLLPDTSSGPPTSASDASQYTPAPEPSSEFNSQIITIVLLGIDSNEKREAANRGYRSDTIAVMAVDVENNVCHVINIPRDTRTRIRKLDEKGKVDSVITDKINSAFAFGRGPDRWSHQNTLAAISEFFSTNRKRLPLNYYASLDMDGIGPLVNAVGGVTVTLEDTMPGVGKKGETVTLDEEKAFIYVRKRHGITGGGDIGRVGRQQQFLRALAQQVKKLGVTDIPRLWSSLNGFIHTNLTLTQTIILAELLADLDVDKIEFTTVPGEAKTIDGTSFYIADKNEVTKLVKKIFYK